MTPVQGNPYVGLRAFGYDDRDLYFGREWEAQELANLWRSNRLVVLYGTSGIGKSSLLCAGAIPILHEESLDVLPVGRASPGNLFSAIPNHNPFTFCLLSSWSPGDSPGRLSELTVAQFFDGRPKKKDRYGDDLPVFAAIDQFEEVLNAPAPWRKHREAFLLQLGEAAKEIPGLRLLVSIREDSIAELLSHEADLAGHARTRLRLSPLSPEAALAAVTGPMARSRRRFAPDVPDLIIEQLRTVSVTNALGERESVLLDSVDPWQLQIVCTQLWERVPPEVHEITYGHVREFGGVEEALTEFCRRTVNAVAEDFGVPEEALAKWLQTQFVTEHGTRGTVYEGLSETGGMPNEIAQALERRRVLRIEERTGSRWYELQHDRMLEPIRHLSTFWAAMEPRGRGFPPTGPSPAGYLRAAEAALAAGELVPAERHAEQVLRATAKETGAETARLRAEALALLGNLALYLDRHELAKDRFGQASQIFESLGATASVARLLAATAKIHLDRREYGKAIDDLEAAIARQPNDPSLKRELAEAMWANGQLLPAMALYSSVIAVAPGDAAALCGRAQVSTLRGDFAGALRDFAQALRLRPGLLTDSTVRGARALALAGVGRLDEARTEAAEAVREGSDNGPALLAAAEVAERDGDHDRAAELARKSMDATAPQLFAYAFIRARDLLLSL